MPTVAELDQKYGVGQAKQPGQAQGQYGQAAQGVSNAVRSLGGGLLPDTMAKAYGGFHGQEQQPTLQQAGMSLMGPLGSVPTQQQIGTQNPFESPQQAKQENVNPMQTAGKNALDFLPLLAGGMNPLGMGGKAMAARAAIGGGSSLAQNIAQGRGANPVSDALSTLTGAAANTYLPPALSKLGGKAAHLAYGKAGEAIPEIAALTGNPITGIGSQGAKQAAKNIGQKIGDLYDQMGVGFTKEDLLSLVDDTQKQDALGNQLPSKLDTFMKDNGISAAEKPAVSKFLQTLAVGPKSQVHLLDAQGMRNTSGVIEKEFQAALNDYLSKNPDIAGMFGIAGKSAQSGGFTDISSAPSDMSIQGNMAKTFLHPGVDAEQKGLKALEKLGIKVGGMGAKTPSVPSAIPGAPTGAFDPNVTTPPIQKAADVNKVPIPGGFWHDFATTIKPSQKVFDAMKKNPDYEMSLEDKIRMGLSDALRKGLKTKLGEESPQALPQLEQLNKLYQAASPIARGTTKGVLPYHLDIMAQLAAAGVLAAPLTGMKMSPYLQMLAPLGFMANPMVSGAVASQAATPGVNAIMNALSSLGASQFSKQVTH